MDRDLVKPSNWLISQQCIVPGRQDAQPLTLLTRRMIVPFHRVEDPDRRVGGEGDLWRLVPGTFAHGERSGRDREVESDEGVLGPVEQPRGDAIVLHEEKRVPFIGKRAVVQRDAALSEAHHELSFELLKRIFGLRGLVPK